MSTLTPRDFAGALLRSCDVYLPQHAHLHVVEEVAVIRPAARHVGADQIAELLARLDVDRVFKGLVRAPARMHLSGTSPRGARACRTFPNGEVWQIRIVDRICHGAESERRNQCK